MSNQIPSVGRVVHYVSYGTPKGEYASECRAAIITEVSGRAVDLATLADSDAWVVGLCVLNPTGMFFNSDVMQQEHARDGGTWHWPEQVGPARTFRGTADPAAPPAVPMASPKCCQETGQ